MDFQSHCTPPKKGKKDQYPLRPLVAPCLLGNTQTAALRRCHGVDCRGKSSVPADRPFSPPRLERLSMWCSWVYFSHTHTHRKTSHSRCTSFINNVGSRCVLRSAVHFYSGTDVVLCTQQSKSLGNNGSVIAVCGWWEKLKCLFICVPCNESPSCFDFGRTIGMIINPLT